MINYWYVKYIIMWLIINIYYNYVWSLMKLNFEMYIQKLHYYQKRSCSKTFIKRFFYFLCCIFSKDVFYNIYSTSTYFSAQLLCRLVILRRTTYLFCVCGGSDIPSTSNHRNANDFPTLYKWSIKKHESRKKYDRVRSSRNNKVKCKISKLFSFQRAQNKWKLSVS